MPFIETFKFQNFSQWTLAICIIISAVALQGQCEDLKPYVLSKTFSQNNGTGNYNYAYELSNGESKQESAQLKHGYLVIRGSYTQIDPETQEEKIVHYVADKNGFRPTGDHLPK